MDKIQKIISLLLIIQRLEHETGNLTLINKSQLFMIKIKLSFYASKMAFIINKLTAENTALKRTINIQNDLPESIDIKQVYRRHNVTYLLLDSEVVMPNSTKKVAVFKSLITGRVELKTFKDFERHYKKIEI